MAKIDKYKGIIVAFYACFDDDGNVSVERTKQLARFYVEKGVKGLYVNGSSGEGFLLSVEERKEILAAVMEEVRNELTVIAHVAAVSTRDSIALAQHAEMVGVDALSAVPSVYYRIPERSIEKYWNDIIDSTNLDFIIYNIPQTTGYQLSTILFKKMIQNEKVIGVKNSSMPPLDIQQFKAIGGNDFLVLNGPDEQYIAGRMMGADGGIGGTYGIMPELFLELEKCIVNGQLEKAQVLQNEINDIIFCLLDFPNLYSAAKEVLKLRGINIGTARLPLEPVPAKELEKVTVLHQKLMQYINKYIPSNQL
ncbi:MAG: dihydrodipicolinate synthase family protein [Bacillaceae bacterium]